MHTRLNWNFGLMVLVFGPAIVPVSAAESAPAAAIGNPETRWSAAGPGGVAEFQRHVLPLLGKAGCNNRACHGSFRGQNGFRLSLFGSDPAADHKALTQEEKGDGPRIKVKAPTESLALKKPTREVMHGGGQRFETGGWQHRMLADWIRAGAPFDVKKESRIEEVFVEPARIVLRKGEAAVPLRLTARFSDGSREDVTALTIFASRDDGVARVTEEGEVSGARPGGTAIVASYGPMVTTCQVLVPRTDDGVAFPEFPPANDIDLHVREQLAALNIRPSEPASDEVFLRRVYLDLIGTLPSPDEARQFLADQRADKRSQLIEQLLARPEYAMYWATIFSDLIGTTTINPSPQVADMRQSWLEDKLAKNWPYDRLVGGILTATTLDGRTRAELIAEIEQVRKNFGARSRGPRKGANDFSRATRHFDNGLYAQRQTLDFYWLVAQNRKPDRVALQTASAFLGLRLDCAQCHKHPFDRWTQQDFEQFQSFFRAVDYCYAPTGGPLQQPGVNQYGRDEVKVGVTTRNKAALERYPPKLLGGKVIPYQEGVDLRVALWDWMRSPDNPYFAPAIANRIWAHYFGVGLVEAIEDFSAGNPPSNPRLLDWLAKDFIEHQFDLKHLHRRILNSRTYQLSAATNGSNRLDERNYSHALLRRLPAEVLLHAVGTATGVPYRFNHWYPEGRPPIAYAPNLLEFPLELFGRGRRLEACGGCDRTNEPSLNQALYLLTDSEISERIDVERGRLAQLKSITDDRKVVEELYLATLSRFPNRTEMDEALAFRKQRESRAAWLEDVLWSLLNVREFILVR